MPNNSEQLQIAFAAARMGVWHRDLDSMALTCTAQCKANFGLCPDDNLDWTQLTGELIHPDDRERMQAAVQRAIDAREDYDVDYRARWPDGSLHWIVSRGRAEYDHAGTPLRMSGVTLDVTERKRAEQLASEQSRLLEMVAAGASRTECLDAISAAVTAMHPGTRAAILLANNARDAIAEVFSANLPLSFSERIIGAPINDLPVGTCGTAIYHGQPISCDDIASELKWSDDWRELCLAHGILACRSTPILSRGEVAIGSFFLCFSQPHQASPWELQLAAFGAHLAGIVCERDRSAQALLGSEARYQRLFESIDEGFCVIEVLFDDDGRARDYRFLETNPAFERHTGLHDACGKRIRELAPQHESHWFEVYGEVARSGEPVRFTNEAAALDRWYDLYAFRIGDPGQHIVAVLFNDITDRRRGEDVLRESEARFRQMADHSPMMVWMTEADARCTFLSQSWYEFTGQDEVSGLGFGWLEAVHPDDRQRAHDAFLAANAQQQPLRLEYRLRRSDGVYRWAHDVASPRLDDAGRMLGYIGSVLDIHERKQAEQDARFLLDISERIRKARDADRLMADITDALGRYLQVTRCYFAEIFEDEDRWRVIHDYHPDQSSIAGDYPISVFGAEVLEDMRAGRVLVAEDTSADPRSADRYETAYKPIGVRAHAVVPLLRDGRWVSNLVAATATPRRWSTRELGLLETVAERVWNARERLQGEHALRETDRRKDEFLATLAHELRNPLAPLRNCLQILRMGDPAQIDAKPLYEVMERQMAQLVRLVNDLLEVARITRGKVELRCEPIDIAEIVERAVETSRPVIDEHGHKLVIDLPRQPLRLMADPLRLAQVLSNLLNNAAKYTEPGGRITLAAAREGDEAVLTVHDTGMGIASEHLTGVFDLFTQADTSLSRVQGGLGIGLTLVRNLVQLHGGSVVVRSEGVGQGSEFEVRLPALDADTETPSETDGEHPPPGDGRHRVLVVDDNREHTDSLALLLSMSGHHVRTAYDGAEGVSAAATFDPDAVLLDIGMPRLDGYEACRRIRQLPGGEHKVMIAVTGWGQDEDRRRGEAAGFDAHLVKPVDPAGLLQVMDTLQRARQAV